MRAISRLAPAPVQSSTGVHSCTVLVAKRDLASQSIRRLDQCRVGFSLVRLLRAVALDRGFAPVPPLVQSAEILFASGQAVCWRSVWFGSDGRAVALDGGFAPVPPERADCKGSVCKRDFCQAFLKKASIKPQHFFAKQYEVRSGFARSE